MDTHSGKYGETTEGSVKDTLAFVDFIKEMKVFIKQTIDNIHILFLSESSHSTSYYSS